MEEQNPSDSPALWAVFACMVYDALVAVCYFFALLILSVVMYRLGQACY